MPSEQPTTNGEKTAMDEFWRPPVLEGEPPVPPGKPTGIKVKFWKYSFLIVDFDCWSWIWWACLCYSIQD